MEKPQWTLAKGKKRFWRGIRRMFDECAMKELISPRGTYEKNEKPFETKKRVD